MKTNLCKSATAQLSFWFSPNRQENIDSHNCINYAKIFSIQLHKNTKTVNILRIFVQNDNSYEKTTG